MNISKCIFKIQIKMGNNYDPNQDIFNMHLRFIGLNMEEFYNNFKNSYTLRNIIKYWEIDPLQKSDSSRQINAYFDYLQTIKDDQDNKDKTLRECLIIKVNNTFDPEVNFIVERMNDLSSSQYMPLILILTTENQNKEIVIDTEEYDQIDPRLIFVENYTEDPYIIEDKIVPILLRFCSIHNELGDVFSLDKDEKTEDKFDLIERAFPFNLNIVCIGRFGQGKSTGVNQILQEYKAKESNKGCSQTKNITFYQVKNKPIRILDVPGFENEKTVQDAVQKLQKYREKLNKLQDSVHIILYFLNFTETRVFMELEYPILEEITNHKSAKLIYVITHSYSKNPKNKKKIFDRINSGIQGVTRNKPIFNKIKMFEATENNVIFVNFHYDKNLEKEPFGKKELFKKIYDSFVNSENYKNSLEKFSNKEKIEETALKLRAQAESILFPNKILGAAVGIIPIADWVIQKYIIKENAIKKVGEIFGIDAKFVDEENEREKKLQKENEDKIYYTIPGLDDETNNSYVIGNKLTNESSEYKVIKTVECTVKTNDYASGIVAANFAINSTARVGQLTAEAAQYSAQAAQLTQKVNNMSIFAKFLDLFTNAGSEMVKQAADYGYKATLKEAAAAQAATAGTLGRFASYGLFGFGIVMGVGIGGYSTYKFCEETLDKFVEYFKKNSDKIKNSYQEAAEYFLQ